MVLSTVLFTLKKKNNKKKDTREGFVVIWSHAEVLSVQAPALAAALNLHIRNVQYLIGNESLLPKYSVQCYTDVYSFLFFVSVFCFFFETADAFWPSIPMFPRLQL